MDPVGIAGALLMLGAFALIAFGTGHASDASASVKTQGGLRVAIRKVHNAPRRWIEISHADGWLSPFSMSQTEPRALGRSIGSLALDDNVTLQGDVDHLLLVFDSAARAQLMRLLSWDGCSVSVSRGVLNAEVPQAHAQAYLASLLPFAERLLRRIDMRELVSRFRTEPEGNVREAILEAIIARHAHRLVELRDAAANDSHLGVRCVLALHEQSPTVLVNYLSWPGAKAARVLACIEMLLALPGTQDDTAMLTSAVRCIGRLSRMKSATHTAELRDALEELTDRIGLVGGELSVEDLADAGAVSVEGTSKTRIN